MLNMGKLVWLFNILPGSAGGGDLAVETGYTDGFLIAPKKFPVQFIPRSDAHVKTIKEELQQCQALFSRYEG